MKNKEPGGDGAENIGFDWSALDDSAQLFPLHELDPATPTDRQDDAADYRALFGEQVLESRPFLNIGAGDWSHSCWSNQDFVQPPYDKYKQPDYNIDLSQEIAWPIADQSNLAVFTSHTIEHLTDPMVAFLFGEVARILKPGGLLRISTPDFHTAFAAWRLSDERYYNQRSNGRLKGETMVLLTSVGFSKGKSVAQSYFQRLASCYGARQEWRGLPLDEGVAREHEGVRPEAAAEAFLSQADFRLKKPNQHINWWTEEKLRHMLVEAGFRLVLRSSYGQSILPLMRNKAYFDRTRPNESIWMEAVR